MQSCFSHFKKPRDRQSRVCSYTKSSRIQASHRFVLCLACFYAQTPLILQDGSWSSSLCLPLTSNRKENRNHIPAGSASFKGSSQQFHSNFCLRFIVHNLVLWPHLVAMCSFNWVNFCPQSGILLLKKTKEEIVRRWPVITVDLQKLLHPFYPIPCSHVITQTAEPGNPRLWFIL